MPLRECVLRDVPVNHAFILGPNATKRHFLSHNKDAESCVYDELGSSYHYPSGITVYLTGEIDPPRE